MFDRIVYMSDKSCTIHVSGKITTNLMNLHLIFEDDKKKILGEIDDLDGDLVKARFLGEIVNGRLIAGTTRKPSLNARVRVISNDEVPIITGFNTDGFIELGQSPFYDGSTVYMDVNKFFSNHFAIFGNTGSGKSCGFTRVFQNIFNDSKLVPVNSNIFLFDASLEYANAFGNISSINPLFNYRLFSTNTNNKGSELLRIPLHLLNVADLALLLGVEKHSQIPIIENMLKFALIFAQDESVAKRLKNHLIAKAIMNVLYSGEPSPTKKNEVFSILSSCSTDEFNLDAVVEGVGYTRTFRQLFLIDNKGQFSESVLLNEYVSSFISDEVEDFKPNTSVYYDLVTLENALNFTLISEGWLRNENTYADAVTIKVRLHELVKGDRAKYFAWDGYVDVATYLMSFISNGNRKFQIININLDDVDDSFAKVLVKIMSRLIFDFTKNLNERASIPFHIVLEEAHRYVQNDNDRYLIGYNIFERIAKEGRKYGVILGLITQRPVELSDTVISQTSSFLIFKINHPVDVEYIRKMVPNITEEIVEKQKTLQSGTCLAFGQSFVVPLIVKMKMPNPMPWSGNSDVFKVWNNKNIIKFENAPVTSVVEEEKPNMVIEEMSQQEIVNANRPVQDTFVGIPDVSLQQFQQPVVDASQISQSSAVEDYNHPQITQTIENNIPVFDKLGE